MPVSRRAGVDNTIARVERAAGSRGCRTCSNSCRPSTRATCRPSLAAHTRIPRQSPSSDGSGALATIDRAQLFANGPGVTLEQSNEVQRRLQGLMDRPWVQWFPQVCISYATATRPAPLVLVLLLVLLALVRAPRMRCSAAP